MNKPKILWNLFHPNMAASRGANARPAAIKVAARAI